MPRYLSCFSLLLFLSQNLMAGKSVEIFMFRTTDFYAQSFVCVIKYLIADIIRFSRRVDVLNIVSFIPAYGTSSFPVANHDNHRQ